MKIEDLKPGMTVWDVHSYRMGNTTMRTMGKWPVVIKEVGDRWVIASWNYNPPKKFYGTTFKWRKNEPVMIRSSLGAERLETREEKKARLAKTSAEA